MVNTGLDRKYVAKEGGQTNFDPIPEGDYRLKVKDIDPWKEVIKTIKQVNKTPATKPIVKYAAGDLCVVVLPWNEIKQAAFKPFLFFIYEDFKQKLVYFKQKSMQNNYKKMLVKIK